MCIEIGNLSGNKEAQHKALYELAQLMIRELIEANEEPYLTGDTKNLIHVFGLVDTAVMCSDLEDYFEQDGIEITKTLEAIQEYVNKERGYS